MTRYREIGCLVRKLQCANRLVQCSVLKEVAEAIHKANKGDLQEILELLISTHDVELQVKLFSVLSAYLINNNANYEAIVTIIKYNSLYETIQNLLVCGSPIKAASTLYFVMTLLTSGDGNSQSLMAHARNMIRISGCLNTMCDMFNSSMMYQDTWIALSQSLAEACRGHEANQNYCAHLVPLCVQRCRLGNVDVCAVLQSLLDGHERNLQLFIECQGLHIFSRQLLQYNMAMQLLNTIVEMSALAASTFRANDIVHHLRDFLRLYGPYSHTGQWATIILYHLDKRVVMESSCIETPLQKCGTENIQSFIMSSQNEENHGSKIQQKMGSTENIRNSMIDLQNKEYCGARSEGTKGVYTNYHTKPVFNVNSQHEQDDTANLFQNVIKEVIYWKSKGKNYPCNVTKKRQVNILPQSKYRNVQTQMDEDLFLKNNVKDLTFSFLMKETQKKHDKPIESTASLRDETFTNNIFSYVNEETGSNIYHNTGNYNYSDLDYTYFNPAFTSTPKRFKQYKPNISNTLYTSKASIIPKRKQATNNFSKYKRTDSHQEQLSVVSKEVKHRSMSERFLNAINESCTTIVKGMKNIFRLKPNSTDHTTTRAKVVDRTPSNLSFTNYMLERDTHLHADYSQNDTRSSIYKIDSCKTCKDTIILQQKMDQDDHLRRTVRKLKMGINLYGCDFKKIAHIMWPRDRYMTSDMLYNLYRKLIVKGGHSNHGFRQKAHKAITRK